MAQFGRLMFRVAVCGVGGLVLLAVLVSRAFPERSLSRSMDPEHPVVVDGLEQSVARGVLSYFDPSTSEASRAKLPDGLSLQHAGFSPWRDEDGRWEVVGLWAEGSGGNSRGLRETSLVHLSVPDGRFLGHISCEVAPAGPVCWEPGAGNRVLYVGTDSKLHVWDTRPPGLGESSREPRTVAWNFPVVDSKKVIITEVCWPQDPRFGGRAIASLALLGSPKGARRTQYQLCWLELDASGISVTAAGPLIPALWRSRDIDQRFPTVTTDEDGEVLLSYLSRGSEEELWSLHVAEVFFRSTGKPFVLQDAGRVLESARRPDTIVFSRGGKFVNCLRRFSPEVLSFEVDSLLRPIGRPSKDRGGRILAQTR